MNPIKETPTTMNNTAAAARLTRITLAAWLALSPAAALADEAHDRLRDEASRELSLTHERENSVSQQIQETRESEQQVGHEVTDVNGNRVRVEQYIFRGPQHGLGSRQFKAVILNTRPEADNRVDQAYSLQTFNKDLPQDLSQMGSAWRQVQIGGAHPEYWLTNHELKAMNSFGDTAQTNQDGGTIVTTAFQGTPVYTHAWAQEKTSINGKDKVLVERLGLTVSSFGNSRVSLPGSNGTLGVAWFDVNGDGVSQSAEQNAAFLPIGIEAILYPNQYHAYGKITFQDNTWISSEQYLITEKGEIVRRDTPLFDENGRFGYLRESQIGASEFKDKIDIVWQPSWSWAKSKTTE